MRGPASFISICGSACPLLPQIMAAEQTRKSQRPHRSRRLSDPKADRREAYESAVGSRRWVSRSQRKVNPSETPSRVLEPRSGSYAGFSSRGGFRLDGFIIGDTGKPNQIAYRVPERQNVDYGPYDMCAVSVVK